MQAVLMAFEVLEQVSVQQPVGVSELARSMEIPKSTAQRMLKTLEAAGWIRMRSTSDPRWILTAKVLTVGSRVGNVEALRAVADEPMRVLGQSTGETVHLVVPDGLKVVLLAKVPSIHALQPMSAVGNHSPIYATSSGKAILAAMPDHERNALLSGHLAAITPNTLTTRQEFEADVEITRARGWAWNREEYQLGISTVGAAIVAHDRPVGGISLSLPTVRLSAERAEELGPLVAATAKSIERGLSAS